MVNELVIYHTAENQVEYDAETEFGKENEIVTISFWVVDNEKNIEIPLLHQGEQPTWLSTNPHCSKNTNRNMVSDSFIEGIGTLTDESKETNGWGTISKDVWTDMPVTERYIFNVFQVSLIDGDLTPMAASVIEHCSHEIEL